MFAPIEAEYEDGYIHSEIEFKDISPFDQSKNILNDVLKKRPEAEHGKMVRFSVFHGNQRVDVDWRDLPDNARPIRFRHISADFDSSHKLTNHRLDGIDFGYQYTDDNGKNHQEVVEL